MKPVHSSTSSSNSVILTCGRIIAVWSIRACAVSGTAASSGVIFRPDSRDDGVRQLVGQRHAVDGGELRFQQRQPVMQVLVAIGGHGQRQFAGLFEAGEFRGRHQVVLEVLELARALHPDVAGRSAFFSSDSAHSS